MRDRPWIVLVGNHNPNKGHELAFEVMRDLRKQIPEARATLIGGNYPADKWSLGRFGVKGGCWYKCRLRSFVEPGIELRRNIPRQDVISAIREADLLLVTSKWEASPLMVLESMAAGTPWVSVDVGCVREHAGGVVVESLKEMVDTSAALLQDRTRRRELGSAGRHRIAERHDWNAVAGQYEKLFRSVSQHASLRDLQTRT
ncbi:MAG TPA: glycosyltransferase family 4 protein [Candidatus Angelobacter sp.]|nr:glycosyltransferase family 4 protein [Candidatus Angelobacter sp.]